MTYSGPQTGLLKIYFVIGERNYGCIVFTVICTELALVQ